LKLLFVIWFSFLLGLIAPASIFADVTLNNQRVVPTDSMIVYILLGHSNMSGRADSYGTSNVDSIAEIKSIYFVSDPYLWSYSINDGYNPTSVTGEWIPALGRIREDFDKRTGENGWMGCGMPFLKKMRDVYPNHHLGVIQVANGWTRLNSHFILDNENMILNMWSQLKAAILDLKGKVRFGGVITMLGIVEIQANDLTAAQTYRNDLDTLITRIRTLAEDSTIPLLPSDIEQGDRKSLCPKCTWFVDTPVGDEITAQILKAEDDVPYTRMINTMWSLAGWDSVFGFPYFRDDHHYNRVGMLKFADAAIDALLDVTPIAPYSPSSSSEMQSSSSSSESSSSSLSSSSLELSSSSVLSSSSLSLSSSSEALSSSSSSESSSSSLSSSSAGPAFVITHPVAGTEVRIHDVIHIQWLTDLNQVQEAYPDVSIDMGKSWLNMGFLTSIIPSDSNWQNISWVIPASMTNYAQEVIPLDSLEIKIRLTTYTGQAKAVTSVFILPPVSSFSYHPISWNPLDRSANAIFYRNVKGVLSTRENTAKMIRYPLKLSE